MSDANPSSRPAWVEAHLKQIEIGSNHLLEQHRRLQQEIYVRLRSRLTLINYAIGSIGGLAGIVTFLLRPSFLPSTEPVEAEILLVISVIFYLGAFVFIFFLLNFLSHSGYIYAASRLIVEQFPSVLADLERRCQEIAGKVHSPVFDDMKPMAHRIFIWENYITKTRSEVQFTDSKFEIWSFAALSITSFLLCVGFYQGFRDAMSLAGTRGAIVPGPAAMLVGVAGLLLYASALYYCFRTRHQVMKFRDKDFADIFQQMSQEKDDLRSAQS